MRVPAHTLSKADADRLIDLQRELERLRAELTQEYGHVSPSLCPDCYQPEAEDTHDYCDGFWERESIILRIHELECERKSNLERACPIHIIVRK